MVVVIGGTGLVGSHLLFELAKTENEITATYQTMSKIEGVKKLFQFYNPELAEDFWKKINWKKVDVNDLTELEELIAENDEVYHCAALVSFDRKDFNQLIKVNREGTTNVVNVCLAKKIRKLCYVSSTSAISGGGDSNVTENTKWKKGPDTTAYSISKNGAEREVWRGLVEGLNAVIVNPSVILGAGNWNESSLTILGQVDKGLSFYPPGGNAFVDARDVAKALLLLMKSSITEEQYLLIGANTSFQNLFETIAKKMGKRLPKIAVGAVGLHIARYLFELIYLFSSKKSPITAETVNTALATTVYSNDKWRAEMVFTFYSLEETIDNAVRGRIK